MTWLSDTEDGGHRIEKIDAAEAWMPTPATPMAEGAGEDEPVTSAQVALWTLAEAEHLDVDEAMTDTEAALALLRALNFTIDNLSTQRREVVKFLADVLPKGTAEIEGFGPVKVANSASYTGWDHSSLVPRLAARIADEQGYPVDPIRAVIDSFLAYTGNPGRYRTEALRTAGLEPDEFASVRWSPSVVIEKDRK
jgi:hypothetical protein